MNMTGERHIPANRAQVWRALTDPVILQTCMPRDVTVTPAGPNGAHDIAAVTVASPAGVFTGNLSLLEMDPPASCRIEASGTGGTSDFGHAEAAVTLKDEGAVTLLRYTVTAELGGRLAEFAPETVETSAKSAADQFFDNLTASVANPPPVAADGPAAVAAAITAPTRLPFPLPARVLGFPLFAWAGAAIFVFILYNLFVS
jgi:carbon monoxide dehydrogenase subunit G